MYSETQSAIALTSIAGVNLTHLHDGEELGLGGPGLLTMSLVKVLLHPSPSPTPSGASSPAAPGAFPGAPPLPPRKAIPDDWLVLIFKNERVELELPLSASARVMTNGGVYTIPMEVPLGAALGGVEAALGKELDRENAGFLRVQLPATTSAGDRETFESILWGMTSFTHSAPSGAAAPPAYAAGLKDADLRSSLVLVDESTGLVAGTLSGNMRVHEDPSMKDDDGDSIKEPVVIEYTETGSGPGVNYEVNVSPLSTFQPLDNPDNSRIISTADFLSRGIIFAAAGLGKGLEGAASLYTSKTKAGETPMVFSARTRANIETSHQYTTTALQVSNKTAKVIGELASGLGNTVGQKLGIQRSAKDGKAPRGIRGTINRSLIAFNAVVDSVEAGGKHLLYTGTSATTQAVGHRYGPEAAQVSRQLGGNVKNIALVYVDARGVSRRALLKSVGKSMIRAKMADGREVVFDAPGRGEQGVYEMDAAPSKQKMA